jgi:hypothetical protein
MMGLLEEERPFEDEAAYSLMEWKVFYQGFGCLLHLEVLDRAWCCVDR